LGLTALQWPGVAAHEAMPARSIDPELKTPYQIRVVLRVADHRMLTPQFHGQLQAELRDQLQLALGKLAQVEVVRAHPLLDDIRTKGLQAVLDACDEFSSVQTHFVLVDFSDGRYQLETGTHDGTTGMSSPVVRRLAVGDRHQVADTAVDMVRKSFAIVGTFQQLKGDTVEVALKGGEIGEPLDAWVQAGDVFAVVRIADLGGKIRGSPIEWAVLRATESPHGGTVKCRYFCRFQDDRNLPDAGPGGGYRCLKLQARSGPVRVRLVDEKKLEFLNRLKVQVSSNQDFVGDKNVGVTLFNGLFEAEGPFTNVAYVRVLAGDTPLVEFPVPLISDKAVVCRMSPDAEAMKLAEINQRKERWVKWTVDALSLADQRRKEFYSALQAPKATKAALEAVIRLGRQHLKEMKDESLRLDGERTNLLALAAKHPISLEYGDQYAAALKKWQNRLNQDLADLEKLVKDSESDQAREMLAKLKLAELSESQADFDQAIELYETVLQISARLKIEAGRDVQSHLDQLKAQWAIKSPEHREARQFIYEVWPGLDLPGVKSHLAKAEESLQRCKDANDRKTPVKLLLVNLSHVKALTKELEVLGKARDDEDAQTRHKAMLQLGEQLRVLQNRTAEWVNLKQ
jgi:tetratricopeptide (TPR) repeat protein